ncbi:hypothetical protein ACFSLT_19725 [Novosphingobium resinovorum]
MQTAPESLRIASTSAYYTERSQSAIALDALALPRTVRTVDFGNSRRAATTAMLDALLGTGDQIVVASEKRLTQAGSAAQLAYGDGAAAVRIGEGGGARLAGFASVTHDLVDRYASQDHPTPYVYEERFVRDVAVAELIVPAIRDACEEAGIEPGHLTHVAVAEPVGGTWAAAARQLKVAAPNHCQSVSDAAGDLGTAMPLYGLGLALAAAAVGDYVLVVGFGSGVDALVFEVTGEVEGVAGFAEVLAQGFRLTSPTRFLNLSGALSLDWGCARNSSRNRRPPCWSASAATPSASSAGATVGATSSSPRAPIRSTRLCPSPKCWRTCALPIWRRRSSRSRRTG